MECLYCHQTVQPGTAFCRNCGCPVDSIDLSDLREPEVVTQKRSISFPFKKIFIVLLLLVLCVLIVAGAYVGFRFYAGKAPNRLASRFENALETNNMNAVSSMIDPSETAFHNPTTLAVFGNSLDEEIEAFYKQGASLALQSSKTSRSWVSFVLVNGKWYIHLPEFAVSVQSAPKGETDTLEIQQSNVSTKNGIDLIPSIYNYSLSMKNTKNIVKQTGTINTFNAFRDSIQNEYQVAIPANAK